MRLLLVEDEAHAGEYLVKGLGENGFVADWVRNGPDAVHHARRGEVLSRTLIAEQVWDMNFDSDTNVVEVAVRRLRGKIDDPFPVNLIHTVRGLGYVMEERES